MSDLLLCSLGKSFSVKDFNVQSEHRNRERMSNTPTWLYGVVTRPGQVMSSAITGSGHGDAHLWQRMGTRQFPHSFEEDARAGGELNERVTYYQCTICGWKFYHFYCMDPQIFEAMAKYKVPAMCNSPTSELGENDMPELEDPEVVRAYLKQLK